MMISNIRLNRNSTQTKLLSKFGSFEQKIDETLEQNVNRFNHLLSRMINHDLQRKIIEEKVRFMSSHGLLSNMEHLEDSQQQGV